MLQINSGTINDDIIKLEAKKTKYLLPKKKPEDQIIKKSRFVEKRKESEKEKIFRNDKIIAEMLTQFQNIKSIEYKDAGHMIPVEIPEQLAKDILKFIERL